MGLGSHAGSAVSQKWPVRYYFCVFNPIELKHCNKADIANLNNLLGFSFDFDDFLADSWSGVSKHYHDSDRDHATVI